MIFVSVFCSLFNSFYRHYTLSVFPDYILFTDLSHNSFSSYFLLVLYTCQVSFSLCLPRSCILFTPDRVIPSVRFRRVGIQKHLF